MQNNIPAPNPFVRGWLKGPECKTLVGRQGDRARRFWRELQEGHIRTGELVGSADVSVHIGGVRNDRWVATLTIRAPYAASHEFGTGRTNPAHVQRAAHDLNKVLNLMAGF